MGPSPEPCPASEYGHGVLRVSRRLGSPNHLLHYLRSEGESGDDVRCIFRPSSLRGPSGLGGACSERWGGVSKPKAVKRPRMTPEQAQHVLEMTDALYLAKSHAEEAG